MNTKQQTQLAEIGKAYSTAIIPKPMQEIKTLEEIKTLSSRYLQLGAEQERINLSLSLVETSLSKLRLGLNPDIYQIPNTFYIRLDGALYRLEFDMEDCSFLSLDKASDVQIID